MLDSVNMRVIMPPSERLLPSLFNVSLFLTALLPAGHDNEKNYTSMKTNNLRCILVFSVLALICLGTCVNANTYFPNDTAINYAVSGRAIVGFANGTDLVNHTVYHSQANGTSPNVSLVSGGSVIDNDSDIESYNSSIVNVIAGRFYVLASYDNSTFNINGGTTGGRSYGNVSSYNTSTLNINGGIAAALGVHNNSTANIRGGCVGSVYVFAYDNSTVNFYGTGLSSVLTDSNYYASGSTTGSHAYFNLYTLTGKLADGTNITGQRLFVQHPDLPYTTGGKFTINNISPTTSFPDLSTLALLSDNVYKDNIDGDGRQYSAIGTNLFFISSQSAYTGFKAGVYKNADTSQIVIAFRGTVPSLSKELLKTIAADSSFLNNIPNTNLSVDVGYAAALVQVVHQKYPKANITLTGHSLGGAIAQVVGKASGFTTITFNAPGTMEVYDQLTMQLTPVIDTGMCGMITNYRLEGEQISHINTQLGSTVTLPAPVGMSIAASNGNLLTQIVANLDIILNLHIMATVLHQIGFQPLTPMNDPNLATPLQKAIQSSLIARGIYTIVCFLLDLGAVLIDPMGGSDYVFTVQPGSPLLASVALPTVNSVVAYSVRYQLGSTWSNFQTIQSGVQYTLPQSANAFEFRPLDASGQSTVLPDGFYFSASFASTGNFSGTLAVSGTQPYAFGQIAFDGIADQSKVVFPLSDMTFEFRAPGTTTVQFAKTATLTTDAANHGLGDYTLTGVTPGTYDIAVKSRNGLRKVVRNVAITGSATTIPTVLLLGGDATNDNTVDIADFGVLVNAYNGDMSVPNSGYDPAADFNYDGVVDIGDFGILVNNYNLSGDL